MWEDLFHQPMTPLSPVSSSKPQPLRKRARESGGVESWKTAATGSIHYVPAGLSHVRGSRSQVGVAGVPKLAHNQGECSPGQRARGKGQSY